MGYERPGIMYGMFPAEVDMTLAQFQPVFLGQASAVQGYGQGGASVTLNTPTAFTATTTSGSPTLTAVTPTATAPYGSPAYAPNSGLSVGQTVVGTGIPANTTITAISGSTITLSANATAAGTAVALTAQNLGTSGTYPLGIAQNNARQNEAVNVMTSGISKAKSAGTFAIGDLLYATTGGVAKATTGSGKFAFCRALEAAVAGDICSVELKNFGVQ